MAIEWTLEDEAAEDEVVAQDLECGWEDDDLSDVDIPQSLNKYFVD